MTTFADRHIGPAAAPLLEVVGYDSLDELMVAAVPAEIRTQTPLNLPPARSEAEVTRDLRAIAVRNRVVTQMIGQGYFDTQTPAVIQRNIIENPAWYTAYTPYQPEISQGRLEAMLNFQTLIADLTGLPVAGASLLDEATAVAEAVLLMRRATRGRPDAKVVVDADLLPQSINVAKLRADAVGLPIEITDLGNGLPVGDLLGVVIGYPGASGAVRDLAPLVSDAKARDALVTVATDPLALTLLKSPGDYGADIAVGSAQRFGVPLYYGGPHAGYIAVRTGLERNLPGRLVGVSVDAAGNPAYRLALATREQHIRREKATSNICTAQALLAVVAGAYACYHGPAGLRAIAQRTHQHAVDLASSLADLGVQIEHETFFDTVAARVPSQGDAVLAAALERGINLHQASEDVVQIACDETTTEAHVQAVTAAFAAVLKAQNKAHPQSIDPDFGAATRASDYLTHPIFNTLHNETALMRYLRALADKDLALDRTMIPLGSCTMKLNAAVEMAPITWPEFTGIHPLAPADQAAGYAELITQLCDWLAEITGYAKVSVQPNAGSQGELAGLIAIRRYLDSIGQQQRDACLIPASAHGTNAASAVLAGLRVVVVASAPDGTIDRADLAAKLEANQGQVAAIMLTYPSTHGVYEEGVTEVCRAVHEAGGQVYIDGANLNALVGIARPGEFGGDVSHLNLHKTFCIPHGGGGPGVGPIGVAAHLAPFLPGDPRATGSGAVSGAEFGSAGVLPIPWAYIALMGPDGLTRATQLAVLSANYVAARLRDAYPILFTGANGLVAHECILDLRAITKATGITAEDVAKRLADYGFHAPTLAFPVAGTLMVEPTESEDQAELDRFIDAMLAIKAEIDAVGSDYDAASSPLRNAPHTAAAVLAADWSRPYSRERAALPPGVRPDRKYWPPVGRIDGAHGDRNLICACPPLETYE